MTATPRQSRNGRTIGGRIHNVVEVVVRWGTTIALIAFVLCYVLLISGLIKNWDLLIGMGSGLAVGLIALILENRRAVERLGHSMQSMVEAASWKLQSLEDCQEHLASELAQTRGNTNVTIHHLGLDMSYAWHRVRELLHHNNHLRQIHLKILMLTHDVQSLGPNAPQEVRRWCESVPRAIEEIREGLEDIRSEYEQCGRSLTVHIRQYTEVPWVHGIAILEPSHVRYFTFCRWDGPDGRRFAWGENRYRRVVGSPADASLADLAAMFDSAFEHLWSTSADTEMFAVNASIPV